MSTESSEAKQSTWKRVFFRSAGFGAGFAVAVCVIGGALFWYSSRPKPPKPWNKNAIRAAHNELGLGVGEKNIILTFTYALENTTDTDYQLQAADVRMMQKTDAGMLEDAPVGWTPDTFVPAHQKVKFAFTVPLGDISDVEAAKKNIDAALTVANKYLRGVHGFVVFDGTNRYEIDMPSGGWEGVKEPSADHLKRN